MDYDADLSGIVNLMRKNIEIRNRSMMKRIYRDCFIASDGVDFILSQGLADSREDAIIMCRKMEERGLIKCITTSKFKDANQYCRFAEDDSPDAVLAASSAGNGEGTHFGEGGCKWSFAPHTAHNSYILDINLAEEVERAVAGASVESRLRAVTKLRARVKEQAAVNAPDWSLQHAYSSGEGVMNIYSRTRPRGEFNNIKITGMAGESPKKFIRSVIDFESRKEWESSFEDGVVVEVIDISEKSNIFTEDSTKTSGGEGAEAKAAKVHMDLAEAPKPIPNLARTTDDVLTYLSTVDLTGVPPGMSVAFLNDTERQHMLSHLRKQIMQSQPETCMICTSPFRSAGEVRFCPCCATACCSNCMTKKVFEVASRQVVTICVHCYRMSSRVWQPPQNVTDSSQIAEELRGKWWRPEGIADFNPTTGTLRTASDKDATTTADGEGSDDEEFAEEVQGQQNVVPGYKLCLDDAGNEQLEYEDSSHDVDSPKKHAIKDIIDDTDPPPPPPPGTPPGRDTSFGTPDLSATSKSNEAAVATAAPAVPKTAKCKKCGETISREIEAIEKHMEECTFNKLMDSSIQDGEMRGRAAGTSVVAGSWWSTPKHLAGITRRPDLEKSSARIIYRTMRGQGGTRPREACCFQDSFVDTDGTCYMYEISIRHCEVRGIPGHITEDVLLFLHAASPVKGNENCCAVSIIYQIDQHAKSPKWVRSLKSGHDIFKSDLIRQFKSCGSLKNIVIPAEVPEGEGDGLDNLEEDVPDPNLPCLQHFELMAVLGRGGFGKVMQVRHIATSEIYAMKILKKSELRRRRQVERTKTERTILAAVQHPFIVQLYYAFQNNAKLYMVMDFVQGGDFFTLMRKFKRMPEDWVRVYIAEIAMALQHLHDMDIVYRDLKPENILLCDDGHLKITDFGLSRNFNMRPPNPEDIVDSDYVTRSFCGTEQYMSPEMLLQQGHNWRMDWWCLGLLMHEMISTRHPFNGPSHYDTLRNMVTKQPIIDSRLTPLAVTVVRGLLVKAPKARLCCHDGLSELKALPFFNGLDWTALYSKRTRAPYIPELNNKEDISSFETTFTKEAAVDSVAETPGKSSKNGGKSAGSGILGFFGFKSSSAVSNKIGAESAPFDGFEFGRDNDVAEESQVLASTATASSLVGDEA